MNTTRIRVGVAAALLLILMGGGALLATRRPPDAPTSPRKSALARDARAPQGVRIKVEVLNTTRTRGLARRATVYLRDRGFDVVGSGTTGPSLDSTLVLDRSNHPDWARLVARALGGARVEARPDSSRYLDVTVLLGASWRAPPEPFYP